MLNPWHKVNKLLTIGINIEDCLLKENVSFRTFKWIPFETHYKNYKDNRA